MTCFRKRANQGLALVLTVIMLFSISARTIVAEEPRVSAYSIKDASTLENGNIVQTFKLTGNVDITNGEPTEVGVVYSDTSQTPEIGGNNVVSMPSTLQDGTQLLAKSGGLKDETTYYARLYAIFSGQTFYSQVSTYTTAIKVKPGEQIGCSNIVSGGNYYVDNGNNYMIDNVSVGNPPAWIAIINDGFSGNYAGNTYDGDGNNAVVTFLAEGTNSLITMDHTTDKRYLHVFNLNFADRPVRVDLSNVYDDLGPSGSLTYFGAQYMYNFNEENDIQEAGVVYAKDMLAGTNSFELEIAKPGVYSRSSQLEVISEGFGFLAVEHVELSSTGTYYVRGYVKADGKYFYSDTISTFVVTDLGSELVSGNVINLNIIGVNGKTQQYDKSVYPGCTARIGTQTYTDADGRLTILDEEGTYYILDNWSDGSKGITYVVIDRTPPVVANVTNGQVYNNAVILSCTEDNVVFYLSKDDGPENEFASGIMIAESGRYTLKAIDFVGNVAEYNFTILPPAAPVPPVVETLDVLSVTTHTAEVTANFQNNGPVIERGFVYSAINNTPVIGGMWCTDFVPQEDLEPGFLTTTLTGLALNSRHFFRAFVKTGDEASPTITYGAIKEFTTPNQSVPRVIIHMPSFDYPTNVTTTTMTIHCQVTNDGGSAVTRRGLVFATSSNPTVDGLNCTVMEAPTGGTGDYQLQMTGLTRGTTYFIRAFATNSDGTAYSDSNFELTTLSTSVPPNIALTSVESITKRTADISCVITSNGGGAITERGVLYSTSANPTIPEVANGSAAKELAPLDESDNYLTLLTDLLAGTHYYIRGYAINEAGTSYSDQDELTTVADNTQVTMELTPQTPTNGDVVVTITYPDSEFLGIKRYKVADGNYQYYTGPFTVTGNCSVVARYTNQNGDWEDDVEFEVTNIDRTKPSWPLFKFTRPSLDYTSLNVVITPGTDSENGISNQSGVDYVEFKYGAGGNWEKYTAGLNGLSIPQSTQVYVRTVDKAGNLSDEHVARQEIRNVELTPWQDNQNPINHGIFIEERPTYGNKTVKTIELKESTQSGIYDDYVDYSSGTSYKGCGVKAAQIFSSWFGYNLTQNEVKGYVETTDFSTFINIVTLGTNWLFDLVDPAIFSTPAQLDSGLQEILNEKFNGYIVERHSPNTKGGAIAIIESSLAHGYPVIMLVEDGYHWQVISESSVTRDENGDVTDASFLVHDNAGSNVRSWSDLDYYFEDNFWAEAARKADYTSYKDTIMTIRYEETPYLDNWSSDWSTSKVYLVQNEQNVSAQYMFQIKNGSGLVHINKVHGNGTIGSVVASYNWSSGWDNASFYQENGSTYLVLMKSSNGALHIHKMNADGTVGEMTEDRSLPNAWNENIQFSLAETVMVNDQNYLLVRYRNSYQKNHVVYLYSFEPGGVFGAAKSHRTILYLGEEDSILGISSVVYEAGGQTYLLIANSEIGEVRIYGIDDDAQIQPTKIASYDWSSGWTKFKPFTVNGKTFLMIAKSGFDALGFGTADPDGMVRFHRINEDGTIGEMTDDAYWDTTSTMFGDYAYDVIDTYAAGPFNQVYLFALRSQDGMVKTLRFYEQDGRVRIKSNLNY